MARFKYKVELHVHLDGAVRPQTVLELSKERGVDMPHENLEEFKKDVVVYEPNSLIAVLECFKIFMPVIAGCPKAIDRIAYEFCEDCFKHNIKYVETRYCPHLLANTADKPEYAIEKGNVSPRDVVSIVCSALERGSRDFGITVKSILCGMTHRPEWSFEIVALCKEFKSHGVVAIDLAGEDFKPGVEPNECLHKQAFKEAYDAGIHRTVHAGENGPAEGVKEALDHMKAERIGHGYHVLDDEELYQRCLKDHVHFEVCPISSIRTKGVSSDLSKHPLLRFVEDGANYSINTDDPVVLDNNLDEDYDMAMTMGLSEEQIIVSIFSAARASFAPDSEKAQMIKDLISVYGEH